MRIAKKITLMTFIIIITGSMAMSAFVYYFQSKALQAEFRSDMARMADRLFEMVNMFLYERAGDVKVFATATKLTEEGYSEVQVAERLIEFRDFYKCYDSLVLFDLNRIYLADTTGLNLGKQHPLERYWLDPLISKELTISVSSSGTIRMPIIYFTYPVKDAKGEVFRVVASRIPAFKFKEILRMRSQYLLESHLEIDLMDRNGLLIYSNYSPKKNPQGKVHYWKIAEARLKEQKTFTPFFFQEEEEGGEEGKNIVFVLQQPPYLDFQGNGWYLMIHLPLKKALAPVIALRVKLIIITSTFIFLACIIAFIFSRKISASIIKLRIVSERFAQGDMDYRVLIKSGDEIEELSNSFNRMAEEIKKSRKELESYAQVLEEKVAERTKELNVTLANLKENRDAVLSILEDTDEAKKKLEAAMQDLRKTEQQLIQAGKLSGIGQMAAGVAHEVNNPLTSILGYAQLIMTNKDLDPAIRQDLQTIERESKRCVTIIENLLNFARPQPAQKLPVDVNNILEETLRVVSYSVEREKIEIIKKYAKDLPKISADPYQLQQVFMNIILNAVHAMPKGGKLIVESRKSIDDGKELSTNDYSLSTKYIEILFSDTGIGIPDENKEKIFEPFFTTAFQRGQKGAGLGLSISYAIVKDHGGRIEVESEAGKGSTFRVILPIKVA